MTASAPTNARAEPGWIYEVRCCRQPHRLLGWYAWPSRRLVHTVTERTGPAPLAVRHGVAPTETTAAVRHTDLRLVPFRNANGQFYLAIYSDDLPIDFWRNLEGFEENHGR